MHVTLDTTAQDWFKRPPFDMAAHTLGPIAPLTLTVEGNTRAQRLKVEVELTVMGDDTTAWRLRGLLVSDAWVPHDARLPVVRHHDALTPTVPDGATAPLHYTFTLTQPAVRIKGDAAWLKYLQPRDLLPASSTPPLTVEAETLSTALRRALAAWTVDTFPVATVEAALETAFHGPVGHFGPVEAHVLERSGQADLAVDATRLGSANDVPETGGEATICLTLYGERFGTWLLQRRSLTLLKPPRKDAPAPRHWHSTVLIAPTADALIAQTELTPTEKRLFQAAGILPHATLWPMETSSDTPSGGDDAPDRERAAASTPVTALDLSNVPDRVRQHLQAIAQLAGQRKLDATDSDLLLKTARQLAKAKAASRPTTKATSRR